MKIKPPNILSATFIVNSLLFVAGMLLNELIVVMTSIVIFVVLSCTEVVLEHITNTLQAKHND